jgi:hypothetical protein
MNAILGFAQIGNGGSGAEASAMGGESTVP